MPDQYPDLVHIAGNVGRDPEYKSYTKGTYAEFSVAVTRQYGDPGKTEWVRVTVWKEELFPWLKANVQKGSRVVIEGNLKLGTGQYEGRNEVSAMRVGLIEWGTKSAIKQHEDDF